MSDIIGLAFLFGYVIGVFWSFRVALQLVSEGEFFDNVTQMDQMATATLAFVGALVWPLIIIPYFVSKRKLP